MFSNPNQQIKPVSAPLATDKELKDYSGSIQDNLFNLFDVSHDHVVSQNDKDIYAALSSDAARIQFIASYLGLQ